MTSLFDKVNTAKELKESEDFSGGLLWNVQDILPKGSLGLLTGSEKSMKSSLAQDLAQAMALGEPFAGRETTQTNVLFIQNENSRLTEHQRLTGSKRESPDNLYFLHGGAFKLDTWEYDNKGRKHNKGLRDLYHFILEKDIGLVILDPLKDLLEDNDVINANQPMAEVLRGITNLRNTLDMQHDKYVTFIIVAHARKQAGEQSLTEKDFRIIPSHILGATTIPAWYEIAFTMSPKINSKTKNGYSIMKVFARNFAFNSEILWGYVGTAFTSIDPAKKDPEPDTELVKKVKEETPDEITTESAQAFLDLAKEQGKVTEND